METFLYVLFYIAFSFLFAYACFTIAKGKGRNPMLWAVLGLVFPLIALIVILLLPKKAGGLTTE